MGNANLSQQNPVRKLTPHLVAFTRGTCQRAILPLPRVRTHCPDSC